MIPVRSTDPPGGDARLYGVDISGFRHLRSSYTWRDIRMDLGLVNALDRGYDLPPGGAYVGQGQAMSPAGVPWGVAVPGMGRSFYMGLS